VWYVCTRNFGDQSGSHKIVMVGIGIQTWRCQEGKVVCVQLHVWLKSFLIVQHVLRKHQAHENGRRYIKKCLVRKEDLNHKQQGNNRNLNIRCNYLLQRLHTPHMHKLQSRQLLCNYDHFILQLDFNNIIRQ
jgi:hypothetical protein